MRVNAAPGAMADGYPYALGGYHRPVTCANELAQTWFDRGMLWCPFSAFSAGPFFVLGFLGFFDDTMMTMDDRAFGFHHVRRQSTSETAAFSAQIRPECPCRVKKW